MDKSKFYLDWSRFKNELIYSDWTEKRKYLATLRKGYPNTYLMIMGHHWRELELFTPMTPGYSDQEKQDLINFFDLCSDELIRIQARDQNKFERDLNQEVIKTQNPSELEAIRFRIKEFFTDKDGLIYPWSLMHFETFEANPNPFRLKDGRLIEYTDSVRELETFIQDKIKSLRKRGKLKKYIQDGSTKEDKAQTTGPRDQMNTFPKLVWTESKNHLYELIYALYKSKALKNTLPEIVEAINSLCEIESKEGQRSQIRNASTLSSKIGDYLKEKKIVYEKNRYFLDTLQSAFIDSLKNEILKEMVKRNR